MKGGTTTIVGLPDPQRSSVRGNRMAQRLLNGFAQSGVSRTIKIVLTAVVVFGVGVVAYLARDLAVLARASNPPLTQDSAGEGGALVICGGGKLPDEVRRRFV